MTAELGDIAGNDTVIGVPHDAKRVTRFQCIRLGERRPAIPPLFFRYHAQARVIVLAWVNDEDTKRTYESVDDAYQVFRKMLESGHPPSDWNRLLAEARGQADRVAQIASATSTAQS